MEQPVIEQLGIEMSKQLAMSMDTVTLLCKRWMVQELAMVSATNRHGDINLFARFEPEANWSLRDWIQMQREFQHLASQPITLHDAKQANTTTAQLRTILYDA